MAREKKNPRYKKVTITAKSEDIAVYASPRIAEALKEVLEDMTFYKGVRFSQVLQAVYDQGKKDGAQVAFQTVEQRLLEAKTEVPHQRPGRPRKG